MKWNPQDIEVYLQSIEFVDTAVIPLLPVGFGSEMKEAAAMTDFISLLTGPLERQFRGRLLLVPGFSYVKTSENDRLISDLKLWEEQILTNGFKHIYYLTSDPFWNSYQSRLEGSLIWLPSIPLESMQESAKKAVIDSQIKQLIDRFMQKWRQ